MNKSILATILILLLTAVSVAQNTPNTRPRASDLGLKVGILSTGPLDTITDVGGVEVGHATIIRGDDVRTGVTAILPHSGNLFREKVPGAVFVGNAFGKLAGSTQVNELGEIETPILLTSTLNVPRVADARFPRTFQRLAVPWQPLKLLETLDVRVLKILSWFLGQLDGAPSVDDI